MNKLISYLSPLAFILAAAPAMAESVNLSCTLIRSPDWTATVTVESGDISTITFSNRSGTVMSSALPVTRDEVQNLPGSVYYKVGEDNSKLMRAEEALLTEFKGNIYFQSPFIEEKEDVYYCGRL